MLTAKDLAAMWLTSRRFLLAVCAAWFVAACSSITFQGGGPVTIELNADRTTVAVGDSVTFDYDVKGTFITAIVIDYGDGGVDSVFTSGAQTASGVTHHAFAAVGSYTVVGRAEDSSTGTARAEVVIQVGGS